MPEPRVLVTTSWDDGHHLDTRLAAELDRFGIAGTFYVAPRSAELPAGQRLSPAALRELAERFEIGSHTLTHARLPRLAPEVARAEIVAGKALVEDIRAGGGVFHLWGHSWEIDARGDWPRLRSFLARLRERDDVEFVTNGGLIRRLSRTA